MEDWVVGEGLADVRAVVRAIEQSKSFPVFLEKWATFSRNLGLSEVNIQKWRLSLMFGWLQLDEVPNVIILHWSAGNGSSATLGVLCNALEVTGLRDVAESVQKTFNEVVSLPKSILFLWKENEFTLQELLGENLSEEISKAMNEHFRKSTHSSQPLRLFKKQILPPPKPKYYVPRTLFYSDSTEVKREIFSSDSTREHVFLFKGIELNELGVLTNYTQDIDDSGKQLELEELRVRFILLECDEDFKGICERTKNPVHIIQHKEKRYFWVKSNCSLEIIRKFLKYQKERIEEKDMVAKIRSLECPCSISIADTPGMGKTLVLANLATEIQKIGTHVIALFIVLEEFVRSTGMKNFTSSSLESIASHSSFSKITSRVLLQMLKRESYYELYVFLDGYDEVAQDHLERVDSFLEDLKQIKNVKILVTTRPHLQTRLENIFGQFSYEIQPFNQDNKIEFLTRYWAEEHGADRGPLLRAFAKQCLDTLAVTLTDEEKKIAGIPLQCMILAEVFAEDARRASKLETLRENSVKVTSFFEMYKLLVEKKFAKLSTHTDTMWGKLWDLIKLFWESISLSSTMDNYTNAHIYHSLMLVFPEWKETFESLLHGRDEVNENQLYSIGLVEKSPLETEPRFIHRTFAEFLLAEFIVKNLRRCRSSFEILFSGVFGRNGTTKEKSTNYGHYYYKLKGPVVAYFIERHLKNFLELNSANEIFLKNYSRSTKVNVEDVCRAVATCCCSDFENIFEYATNVLSNIGTNVTNKLRDQYFKELLHVVVEHCQNVNMVKKVLDFTKDRFGADLSFHTYEFKRDIRGYLHIHNFTPLHVAIYSGKRSFVMSLLNEYGNQVHQLKCLLHACVFDSGGNSLSVIEDKQFIIYKLVSINPDLLEENDERDCTPLLQYNVHFTLLKHLVEAGANINTHSRTEGTIIHSAIERNSYMDLVKWAFSKGFNLMKQTDYLSRTPYEHLLEVFGKLDDEVQMLFDESVENPGTDDEDSTYVETDDTEPEEKDLILEEGSIGINEIARVMERAQSFVVLLKNWRAFAEFLGVNDVVLRFERRLNIETIQLERLPREILKLWKAEKGKRATLSLLCVALVHAGVPDIAETLQESLVGANRSYRNS